MTTYSPTLTSTTEAHGLDRFLLRVGATLTALGERRAQARAEFRAASQQRALETRSSWIARDEHLHRTHDNAVAGHPLLLR